MRLHFLLPIYWWSKGNYASENNFIFNLETQFVSSFECHEVHHSNDGEKIFISQLASIYRFIFLSLHFFFDKFIIIRPLLAPNCFSFFKRWMWMEFKNSRYRNEILDTNSFFIYFSMIQGLENKIYC